MRCCRKDEIFLHVSVDLPKVNGFAALNTRDSSVVLNWTRVAGVSGYLLTWRHISGGKRDKHLAVWMIWWKEQGWHFQAIKCFFFLVLESKSQKLGPSFSSHKITDLQRERTYIFTIRPLFGEVEGPISTVYQKIGKTLQKWFESLDLFWGSGYQYFLKHIWRHLSHHFYVPEQQDPPMVTVPSVPTTVAPQVTPTVARTTEQTSTVPATKSRTTGKPQSQPRVTQSREGDTSDKSTTSGVIGTTSVQRSGILASVLWSMQWYYTAAAASEYTSSSGISNKEWLFSPVLCFLSVRSEQGHGRYRVPGWWVLQHWPQQLYEDKRLHIPCNHLLSRRWPSHHTGLLLSECRHYFSILSWVNL